MTRCRCICFSLITRSFSEPQTILAIKAIEVMCFVAFIIFKISFNNEDIVVSYNVPFLPTLNSQTVKLFFSQDCQQLDAKMAANLTLILGHPIRRDLEILLELRLDVPRTTRCPPALSTRKIVLYYCIILLLLLQESWLLFSYRGEG